LTEKEVIMAVESHDLRGLKCPQPTLRLTVLAQKTAKGSVLEVMADCPTFEDDIRGWCERMKKTLLWIRDEGSFKRCQVQL
jgi:tRNA 2-thiouridine synthesizing protein A